MSVKKIINTTGLLKISLVLAVLSQLLVPIYSDRNFQALGEGGMVQKVCFEEMQNSFTENCQTLMERASFYDSLIFTTHFYFGDLGLLVFQILITLLISLLLAQLVLARESKHEEFRFFLYLMSLVGIFYGRDISPNHFVVLGFLFLMLLVSSLLKEGAGISKIDSGAGSIIKIITLLYICIFTVVSWKDQGSFFKGHAGEDLFLASYSIGVSGLLLVLQLFGAMNGRAKIFQLLVCILLFGASFMSPLLRMLFPIISLTMICIDIEASSALSNMSGLFSRFISSLSFLSGYALVFFLLAFIFTQAEGAFRYPMSTLFMPVKKIDEIIERGQCVGKESGFGEVDMKRFSGYLRYRQVYSGLKFC